MIDFALVLTRDPHAAAAGGAEALRSAGFADRAIHDICHVTSYYNYVNRLAEGLGVELEPHWSGDDRIVTVAEFEASKERRRLGSP